MQSHQKARSQQQLQQCPAPHPPGLQLAQATLQCLVPLQLSLVVVVLLLVVTTPQQHLVVGPGVVLLLLLLPLLLLLGALTGS
jgi:hypothetical protein